MLPPVTINEFPLIFQYRDNRDNRWNRVGAISCQRIRGSDIGFKKGARVFVRSKLLLEAQCTVPAGRMDACP